jgi:hypothetical protein
MQLDAAFAELRLVQDFIPPGNSNRPGTKLAPRFITIHNTDNTGPGANAAAHAKYQKGADARQRQVSWHFTVDDRYVYQSLPTNEVGWHAGTHQGNTSSIGIEICMHPEMDVPAGYRRAALLVAVMARRLNVNVPAGVVQHQHWSGKDCPRVLRHKAGGWEDFLKDASDFARDLQEVQAEDLAASEHDEHGHAAGVAVDSTLVSPAAFVERSTVIARAGLRLRAGPGTEFEIVSVLPFGMRVAVVSRFGDWSMVDVGGDGAGDGFVHAAFLKSVQA